MGQALGAILGLLELILMAETVLGMLVLFLEYSTLLLLLKVINTIAGICYITYYYNHQLPMQQSYLSNEDQQQDHSMSENHIPEPEKKMYGIESNFMMMFKKNMEQIHMGIQNVLISLTKSQQGQKRRLPYNVLKIFQKSLKQMRQLKSLTQQQNKRYKLQLQNRQKLKQHKNSLFKQYLKQLGSKRQQLKVYLNKLETRVRNMEDNGYAQFVEYDVQVPEINTIRFSYSGRKLLGFVEERDMLCGMVGQEVSRRKKLEKLFREGLGDKEERKETCHTQQMEQSKHNKQIIKQQQKIPLIMDLNTTTPQSLTTLKTYKYFSNERILLEQLIRIKIKKQQTNLQIQKLKQSNKMNEQNLYRMKLKLGFLSNDEKFTKTDTLIYLKQMQNQIKEKVENRIFVLGEGLYRCRSMSLDAVSRYRPNT